MITGQNGGYVLLDPKEAPSRIFDYGHQIRIPQGMFYKSTMLVLVFLKLALMEHNETAWTLDGGFNASFITAGEIVGITIRGTTLISDGADYRTSIANGKMTWYLKKLTKILWS